MGKGGGGGRAPTTQTVNQTNLPEYARPYFERLLKRTEGESLADYIPYEDQRIADTNVDITDSQQKIRDIFNSGIAGLPESQERIRQGLNFDAGKFDSATAQDYMSPYMQNVVDVQKEKAILDAQRMQAGRDADAVRAGAFSSSRRAITDALADEGLSRQLAEIQAQGQQQAFENAQSQFERDRTAAMGAEKIGLGSAESLAALGQRARAGDIEAAGLLESVGKNLMARDQSGLDMAYEDFVRQRDYPREQLQFLSSILRGVPVSPSTEQSSFQAYNPIKDLLGTGISAYGLYKGFQ
jgi:hypothetical protein|tara:strand:+ start:261 stop:1151 length:891 start_codon:yes stop_codon:yes gene_type:complete